MSILDSLLTPQNVRTGVNFLQNNQGIMNTLTGLPIGPSSGRAYIRNISGSQEPITEDFFNADQLGEIKNRTASGMADRSMYYDNIMNTGKRDFFERNKAIGYDLSNPISMSGIFSNPSTDIDATLGKFTYRENPDGTTSAIDKHDFDGTQGGENKFYGNKEKYVGQPQRLGYRELPFLEPNTIDADPGEFMGMGEDDQGFDLVAPAGPANMYQPYFPGGDSMGPLAGKFLEGNPEYQVTKQEEIYESPDTVLGNVIDSYKKGDITGSKLSRFIGGMFGQIGYDESKDLSGNPKNYYTTTGNETLRNNFNLSSVPINVNLGKISHLDKLRSNKNFAKYVSMNKNIPSQIRKESSKYSGPISNSPINVGNPFGYGGGNRGGDRDPNQGNTQTGFGRSGMGRDPNDRMAMGGLIDLYRNGGFI